MGGSLRYLNQEDCRDIRNLDYILTEANRTGEVIADKKFQQDLWVFFRRLRVRLDKAGDKTKPFQPVKPRGRIRAKARAEFAARPQTQ